jgi:glycosyltransferase involved in cell wall biosynthesis
MDMDGIYVDITSGAVKFEHLLEYDTIFVQRLHSWDSFYVLERLRKAGKRIVYDIDDDLFSIPADNPASKAIGRNEQMAAVECMKLADVVTTTTTTLQGRLESLIGRTPMVVPNSLDPDGGWLPTPMTGSPDLWKRIFWQGSNTHAEDWNECFDAVNHVMQKREDVRVVILGYLPPVIQAVANEPHWKGRIEYLEPMEPESYFQIIKHVRAEVGLAPLQSNWFNLAKSPIKWLENALIGMPTVASLVGSYTEMEGDREIVLCSTTVEWIEAIERCLNDGAWRKKIVETARRKARREYDIHNTARTWKQLLVG